MAYIEIVEPAEHQGERFELTKEKTTLGRVDDNDFQIPDSAASSHHATIVRDGQTYTLRDLGSTNGTLLNDVEIGQSRLNPGDMITIGSVRIRFDGDDVELDDARRLQSAMGGSATNTTVLKRSKHAQTPAAFETKRSTKGIWITVGIVVGIALAGMLYWFLSALFQG